MTNQRMIQMVRSLGTLDDHSKLNLIQTFIQKNEISVNQFIDLVDRSGIRWDNLSDEVMDPLNDHASDVYKITRFDYLLITETFIKQNGTSADDFIRLINGSDDFSKSRFIKIFIKQNGTSTDDLIRLISGSGIEEDNTKLSLIRTFTKENKMNTSEFAELINRLELTHRVSEIVDLYTWNIAKNAFRIWNDDDKEEIQKLASCLHSNNEVAQIQFLKAIGERYNLDPSYEAGRKGGNRNFRKCYRYRF